MIGNIIKEMWMGNFSFLILFVGVVQTVLMCFSLYFSIKAYKNKKK